VQISCVAASLGESSEAGFDQNTVFASKNQRPVGASFIMNIASIGVSLPAALHVFARAAHYGGGAGRRYTNFRL
jgi:hypothetical protein